mmetsp:Transcript_62403/g.197725  ORF Transcript_62403/g.197725 Transcript_62403/m.197725 type:complete len:494 (-) Transcript_62403:245-1726(-)
MRYCGWLITCPVLLIHLSNLTGEEVWNVMRMMKLVLLDQTMIMFGASAAMSEGSTSFGLYIIGVMSFGFILRIIVQIFNECMSVFPAVAHDHLVMMVTTFALSWASFGVLWHFGPEGWGVWDKHWSSGFIHIADIISKQIYCYMGWHLRWKILRKAEKNNKLELVGGAGDTQHNILILEDDDVMVSLFHIKLRHHKCQVDSCRSVDQLTNLVEASSLQFDFILGNYELIRANNYELMYKLRKTGSILPVVAYSRIFAPEETAQMMRSGVDDYIEAPFNEEDVKQILKRWHRPKRELRGSLDKHVGADGGKAPPAGRRKSQDKDAERAGASAAEERELGMKMARRLSQSSQPGIDRASEDYSRPAPPPASNVHVSAAAPSNAQAELEKQQLGSILSMMQKQMISMQQTMVTLATNPELAKEQMAAQMGAQAPVYQAPVSPPPAPVPAAMPMPMAAPGGMSPPPAVAPGGMSPPPAGGYQRQGSGSQNSWYEMMI